MRVPGMSMHEIRIDVLCVEIKTSLKSPKDKLKRFWSRVKGVIQGKTGDPESLSLLVLIPETAHVNLAEL